MNFTRNRNGCKKKFIAQTQICFFKIGRSYSKLQLHWMLALPRVDCDCEGNSCSLEIRHHRQEPRKKGMQASYHTP